MVNATLVTADKPDDGPPADLPMPLVGAYGGGLLIWLSFPPVGWSLLAWFAVIPWLKLIGLKQRFRSRDYWKLYGAGVAHWLLMLHWIRLPHWTAWFGWLLLAIYLGIYLPLFVGISRWCTRQARAPLWLVAPCVWTSLEWLRGYLLTGFSLGLWGHTQVDFLALIQCAAWGGAYAVSFWLVLMAATLEHVMSHGWRLRYWMPMVGASIALAVTLAHGQRELGKWQQGTKQQGTKQQGTKQQGAAQSAARATDPAPSPTEDNSASSEPLRVALIQGSIDTTFDALPPPGEGSFAQYLRLTQEAFNDRQQGPPDLVIWPETMFPEHLGDAEPQAPMPPELQGLTHDFHAYLEMANAHHLRALVSRFPSQWILGAGWLQYCADGTIDRFNSTLHLNADGTILSRYDKMHPVMFGEYVPLGDWFPWLYRLTPIPAGLTPGTYPRVAEVRGIRFSPSICFENTVPHRIAQQVRYLDRVGTPPDVLVTATNDGWFWGSCLLDWHLTCGIFRSVEHRCTGLIAANTGFSAWIDPAGEVRLRGPRRQTAVLRVDLHPPPPGHSLYRSFGDWFSALNAVMTLAWVAKGKFRPPKT